MRHYVYSVLTHTHTHLINLNQKTRTVKGVVYPFDGFLHFPQGKALRKEAAI